MSELRFRLLLCVRCGDGTASLAQAEDRSLHVLETYVGRHWILNSSFDGLFSVL
jgi:hypothetical protein